MDHERSLMEDTVQNGEEVKDVFQNLMNILESNMLVHVHELEELAKNKKRASADYLRSSEPYELLKDKVNVEVQEMREAFSDRVKSTRVQVNAATLGPLCLRFIALLGSFPASGVIMGQ